MSNEVYQLPADIMDCDRDQLALAISDLWQRWYFALEGQRQLCSNIKEYVHATDSSTTANVSNEHQHKMHIPIISDIRQTMQSLFISALYGSPDWAQFQTDSGEKEDLVKKAKLEAYIKKAHRATRFQQVAETLLDDYIDCGNCFAEVVPYRDRSSQHPMDQVFNGAKVLRINPDNIVFNVTAASFAEAPKIIREIVSIGDVLKRIGNTQYSEEYRAALTNSLAFRNHVRGHEFNEEFTNSEIAEVGLPWGYYEGEYLEVLRFYGDLYIPSQTGGVGELKENREIIIIDRRFVLEDREINTWDKRPLIYHAGYKSKPNNLLCTSPLANLLSMQYMINHLENQRADFFDDIVKSDIVVDGNYTVRYSGDGRKEYLNEDGRGRGVSYIKKPTDALNADFKIRQLKEQMKESAGIPNELAGFRSQGEKTKFEVSTLTSNAQKVLMSNLYKLDAMNGEIVNAEIQIAARSGGFDEQITTSNEDGMPVLSSITRSDFEMAGKFAPAGAKTFARLAVLARELESFSRQLQMDAEVREHVSSIKIARLWEEYLNLSDIVGLIEPNVRVHERLEAQQLQIGAQKVLEEEAIAEGNDIDLQGEVPNA